VKAATVAELLKVATVRALWLGAVLASLALPLTSLVVAAADGLGSDDTITSGAATGSIVGLLAFGAWAATLAAGEYSLQTIVVSLAAVPHRARLYLAKLAAAAVIGAVGGLASATAAWLVVFAVTPGGDHDLGHPAAMAGVVLAGVAVAVTATAVGVLTRSPTASITVIVLAILAPKAAGGLLGGLEPWVIGASPGTVITQMVGGAQLADSQTYPAGTVAAALTMVGVAAVVALAGALVFARRDA
jgi:ABC-2 type transport system permease protein